MTNKVKFTFTARIMHYINNSFKNLESMCVDYLKCYVAIMFIVLVAKLIMPTVIPAGIFGVLFAFILFFFMTDLLCFLTVCVLGPMALIYYTLVTLFL